MWFVFDKKIIPLYSLPFEAGTDHWMDGYGIDPKDWSMGICE